MKKLCIIELLNDLDDHKIKKQISNLIGIEEERIEIKRIFPFPSKKKKALEEIEYLYKTSEEKLTVIVTDSPFPILSLDLLIIYNIVDWKLICAGYVEDDVIKPLKVFETGVYSKILENTDEFIIPYLAKTLTDP